MFACSPGPFLAIVAAACLTTIAWGLSPEDQALVREHEISADQLMPLALNTVLVEDGQARAIICYADVPVWRDAAAVVQGAIAEATGVKLPMITDTELSRQDCEASNVILLGHLDNNRHVARLYHNYFVCLDVGYTGREGYVLRSVHNPWGLGHNYILVGGSFAEGTALAAQAFAKLVSENAHGDSLKLGRLLTLVFDPTDRQAPRVPPLSDKERDKRISRGRELFASPGQGRSGISLLANAGVAYHRTGDPKQLEVYAALMHALVEYYATDAYINSAGLARYDRDFRDAWTYRIGVLWDLLEESGAFSDADRLTFTNYCIRIALECTRYQGYYRPEVLERWRTNEDIVHNHNTFPALGVYFVGMYLKRHYAPDYVDDWLTCARGVFRGQRHASKPQEDAASYQWLPIIHTMAYSLAEGDTTFFDEGHARETARVAMMVMDNAGWEAAFGDHSGYKGASVIAGTLPRIAWYYRDPHILWAARRAGMANYGPLQQPYYCSFEPEPPTDQTGVQVAALPRSSYDFTVRNSAYPTAPNLPFDECFDKMTLRAGLALEDEYLLLDGFGRGNHMHFDANAIIRYAAGGQPLLVDGEYIKNAPKYHNSLVIIRDGQAELTPAVTGLRYADMLDTVGVTSTYLTKYNGAKWTRNIVWLPGNYMVVQDKVEALEAGDYTLRCCWRPWGDATLDGGRMTATHPPMRVVVDNQDPGVSSRLEEMKVSEGMPISRLSQQVSRTLGVGDTQRFTNLVYSKPLEDEDDLRVREVGKDLAVISGPDGNDLIATGQGLASVVAEGFATDAEMVMVRKNRLAFAGLKQVTMGDIAIESSSPISLEIASVEGSGVVVTREKSWIKLHLGEGAYLTIDGQACRLDAQGIAGMELEPGRHALRFPAFSLPHELDALAANLLARADQSAGHAGPDLPDANLTSAWRQVGFDPTPEILPVKSVTCDQPFNDVGDGRYGPFEKLVDHTFGSSTNSVMWPAGVTPTIVLDLGAERDISSVLLREWHMYDQWDVGARTLEISSDGFVNDVREIPAPLVETGTDSFGNNVNTLVEAPVGQRAQQIRLTISPAREECSVYIAEIEIHGLRPGVVPGIQALATGDLTGDGSDDIVICSDAGQVRAITAGGEVLWTFAGDRARINTVACADVDGDGRSEVIFGGAPARLGLLSPDGKELWSLTPPKFRGIHAEVMTVLPADLDGDGLPEIVCGCKSWEYFAYDAAGKKVWDHVIYAHSATVSCADDFDGDGLPEIVAGNAYYRLNIIDNDGETLCQGGRLGPEQTAVSSVDINADGIPEALLGTDGGELVCYATDASEQWRRNLGDQITRVVPVDLNGDGTPAIVCAAESANVFALDLGGEVIWRTSLPDGSSDLAVWSQDGKPRMAVAAGSAGVYVLDGAGSIIGRGETDGRAMQVAVIDGSIVVSTTSGQIEALDMP